jgi:hypothetical protein
VFGRAAKNNMSVEMATVSTGFDIFAPNPMQEAVQETVEITYKPIPTIDETDLEFNISAGNNTYVDTNIRLFLGETINGRWQEFQLRRITNNFLHSVFCQCTI